MDKREISVDILNVVVVFFLFVFVRFFRSRCYYLFFNTYIFFLNVYFFFKCVFFFFLKCVLSSVYYYILLREIIQCIVNIKKKKRRYFAEVHKLVTNVEFRMRLKFQQIPGIKRFRRLFRRLFRRFLCFVALNLPSTVENTSAIIASLKKSDMLFFRS